MVVMNNNRKNKIDYFAETKGFILNLFFLSIFY